LALTHSNPHGVVGDRLFDPNIGESHPAAAIDAGLNVEFLSQSPPTHRDVANRDRGIVILLVLDIDPIRASVLDHDVANRDIPDGPCLEPDPIMKGIPDDQIFKHQAGYASRPECVAGRVLPRAIAIKHEVTNSAVALARDIDEVPAGAVLKLQNGCPACAFEDYSAL
jgi:hypothetical protein